METKNLQVCNSPSYSANLTRKNDEKTCSRHQNEMEDDKDKKQNIIFTDDENQTRNFNDITDININRSSNVQQNEKNNRSRNNSTSANNNNDQKFQFTAPNQQVNRKWKRSRKKQFKCRQQKKQSQQSVERSDIENAQNVKNQQVNNRKIQAQKNFKQTYNNKKPTFKRMIPQFSIRSKFFLPDKRPRKEIIIPPTKFLLGGNISDPLNLNSLQDEALNSSTPNATPKQSPITTPPKVEVIIPPNIHDPLHLLDPVDSMEYVKQLVSPMKRKSKSKHRHRKKRPKKKHADTSCTSLNSDNDHHGDSTSTSVVTSPSATTTPAIASDEILIETKTTVELQSAVKDVKSKCDANNKTNSGNIEILSSNERSEEIDKIENEESTESSGLPASKRNTEKEKVTRDLRLDLTLANAHQQQQQQQLLLQQQNQMHSTGRKRKSSEGPNSAKNKFRRMDSLDKIVSPVVPQPGAWKRPPRTVPTGGRKNARVRSTSVSESELVSPTEEAKTIESESTCGDTADVENSKQADTSSHDTREQSLSNVPKKFEPNGAKYQYGNYDRYPGYRNLTEFMDVRLQVFKRHVELFKGKDILDIGCNVGHMTIAVAQNLAPKSILGIDIDSNLITRARRNLSLYVKIPNDETGNRNVTETVTSSSKGVAKRSAHLKRRASHHQNHNHHHHHHHQKSKLEISRNELFPISFPLCYGSIPNFSSTQSSSSSREETSPAVAATKYHQIQNEFTKNVFFRVTNYVLSDESLLNNDTQQYDLILCLSVTKWIHLNFGDAGLKLAFKRMFNQLRPGGKLILEAQNWASYKKRKNLTETTYNNYKNIEFFPNKFHEYLLSTEVGFSHSYTLGVPRHLSKGFCRPIQLYAKGDFTPSHIRWSDNYHPQITPYEAYRGIYAAVPRAPHPLWNYDTPRANSGAHSCRQTPMYQPTSQYYNPLETDTYLPSYDTEILNRHYVFASPLYQTVWSPPPSLRNSSSHTPLFGSVRECDIEDTGNTSRHVYPPNDDGNSPQVNRSIREPDLDDSGQSEQNQIRHIYANDDNSLSPQVDNVETSPNVNPSRNMEQQIETIDDSVEQLDHDSSN